MHTCSFQGASLKKTHLERCACVHSGPPVHWEFQWWGDSLKDEENMKAFPVRCSHMFSVSVNLMLTVKLSDNAYFSVA